MITLFVAPQAKGILGAPDEIKIKIFEYLDLKEQFNLLQVCRDFNKLLNEDS
jgi:hypothetical protein